MKQWITEEQFNELIAKQKDTWYQFLRKDKDSIENTTMVVGYPGIGEMISFLHENYPTNITDAEEWHVDIWTKPKNSKDQKPDHQYLKSFHSMELCDALWEAVREVLNDEK